VTGFWKSYKKSQKPPLIKGYYGMIIVYDDQWYYQCTYSEFSPFIILNSVPYMSRFAINNPLFLQLIHQFCTYPSLSYSCAPLFTISQFHTSAVELSHYILHLPYENPTVLQFYTRSMMQCFLIKFI